MKSLRVVDQTGNKQDFETDYIPRIGERIVLHYAKEPGPVRPHYYRVKDVMYLLDESDTQAGILVEEETNPRQW